MRATTVAATLRYSAEAKGAWRSLEVGAEATLTNSDESWEAAQAELYHRLGQQLKTLWTNGNSKDNSQEGHQINAQPAQTSTPPPAPPENWCSEHGVTFKARNGPHGEFFSHQIKGTRQWCNQSRK